VYEIDPQKIVNIFEGYYTQEDLFGDFNFTVSPTMKELIADNYPERDKIKK